MSSCQYVPYTYIIQLTPLGAFQCRLHQVPKLPIILNYLYLQIFSLLFFKLSILTHPDNFPCGRTWKTPITTELPQAPSK